MTGDVQWLARMVIQWGGAALAARGYGDDALWQELGGALITAVGAAWSYRARKAQLAAEPPR